MEGFINDENVPYFATRCDPVKIFIPTSEKITLADLQRILPDGAQLNLTTDGHVIIFANSTEEALKKVSRFFEADKWVLHYEGTSIFLS